MIKITYIGHAAVLIHITVEIVIDPYLKGSGWREGLSRFNPNAALSHEEIDPDFVLLTHGHADHVGQTVELLERTNARIVASPTVCNYMKKRTSDDRVIPIDISQELTVEGVTIRAVPAEHRHGLEGFGGDLLGMLVYRRYLPCGTNMGYVLSLDETTIYHSGDTCHVEGVHSPDIAFLSMDGDRTMNETEALQVIERIVPQIVVPIHYRWNMGEKQLWRR